MTRYNGPIGLGRPVPWCLALLLIALACRPAQTRSASPGNADRGTATAGISHDLSRDESAGGHTLRKHVGKTDEELRERLRRERGISAASTWTDRPTAEHAVGAALEQNHDKIGRWLNRSGGHPNLVVDFDGVQSHPVGRSMRRGADHAEPCSHATIVLKWVEPSDYYVLTSYPECRE
jgi:hypothetical protein